MPDEEEAWPGATTTCPDQALCGEMSAQKTARTEGAAKEEKKKTLCGALLYQKAEGSRGKEKEERGE